MQPPQHSTQSMSTDIIKNPLDLCSSSMGPHALQHQSRSYPGGPPLLCRTPSASSQSSLDSSTSKPVSFVHKKKRSIFIELYREVIEVPHLKYVLLHRTVRPNKPITITRPPIRPVILCIEVRADHRHHIGPLP